MTLRVSVKPELLRWACERSGRGMDYLENKFKKLSDWKNGTAQPTLKQLESFAKTTYTPFGYLLLDEPPEEPMPIPDFRTFGHKEIKRPSPNMLDTIYICQQRQVWYEEFVKGERYGPLDVVGSVKIKDPIEKTAKHMRDSLGFSIDARRHMHTWTEALRQFVRQADEAGVMVMMSGVVGSNNTRKLNLKEFRGFALSDSFAPLVFVNGNDTKSAQMFTLAHELAHIWLGESGLSDIEANLRPSKEIERWCDRVAAEFLVPLTAIKENFKRQNSVLDEMNRLARAYKVSTLVILRRIFDAGFLTKNAFNREYDRELERLKGLKKSKKKGGGDFYLTTPSRVSRRFATNLLASTFEGQTSFTEALRLLGIRKMETFNNLAKKLGVLRV